MTSTAKSVPRVLVCMILLWGVAVVCGALYLMDYSGTPGTTGAAAETWPSDSTLPRNLDKTTIVMFAHPMCPCTHSSVEELSRIMAHADLSNTSVILVFRIPPGRDAAWAKSSLWNKAKAIPNAEVRFDTSGEETRRFGAETSGYVVAYDAKGRLRFRGGITPARNHEGSSHGGTALMALMAGSHQQELETSAVFGCPLFGPNEACFGQPAAGN